MFNTTPDVYSEPPIWSNVKQTIGFIMIGGGVLIAGWTLWNLYLLYTDPQAIVLFAALNARVSNITPSAQQVGIPLIVWAYAVPFVLLFTIGSTGHALISVGKELIQNSVPKLEQRVQQMERMMDAFTAAEGRVKS